MADEGAQRIEDFIQ